MPKHPCEDGLSPACFRAYPTWARQALAYKVLHILVPKPLTGRLPRPLNLPLVAPGSSLPPGMVLPPGATIPPNFSWPANWKPGDPLPPSLMPPPGYTPPEAGSTPPLYVQPWEPGPIHTPIAGPGERLLISYTEQYIQWPFGDSEGEVKIAPFVRLQVTAHVSKIYVILSKEGDPTDNVSCDLWEPDVDGSPKSLLSGGLCTPVPASAIPATGEGLPFTLLNFPSKPLLTKRIAYLLVCSRSGSYDYSNYFYIHQTSDFPYTIWFMNEAEEWGYELWYRLTQVIYGY